MGRSEYTFFQRRHINGQYVMKGCSTSLTIRDMKIKTTVRHLTPVRIATIKKKKEINKCWWGCGETEALCTVDRDVKWCSYYGERCEISTKKIKSWIIIWSNNSTSGYLPRTIEISIRKRCLHSHIHWSLVHSGQEVETI